MLSVAICIIAVLVGIALRRRRGKTINEEVRLDGELEDLQHPLRLP